MQTKRNYGSLILFFIVCYAVAAFGALFSPGEWYEGLQRAPWNPPNYVFGIVWTILYAMIALAGWLIFASDELLLKQLWVVQLVLNGIWSWFFFEQHWVGVSLVDIALLGLVLLVLIVLCFKRGLSSAGFLLVPYIAWIGLAKSLNTYIWLYN